MLNIIQQIFYDMCAFAIIIFVLGCTVMLVRWLFSRFPW